MEESTCREGEKGRKKYVNNVRKRRRRGVKKEKGRKERKRGREMWTHSGERVF